MVPRTWGARRQSGVQADALSNDDAMAVTIGWSGAAVPGGNCHLRVLIMDVWIRQELILLTAKRKQRRVKSI